MTNRSLPLLAYGGSSDSDIQPSCHPLRVIFVTVEHKFVTVSLSTEIATRGGGNTGVLITIRKLSTMSHIPGREWIPHSLSFPSFVVVNLWQWPRRLMEQVVTVNKEVLEAIRTSRGWTRQSIVRIFSRERRQFNGKSIAINYLWTSGLS